MKANASFDKNAIISVTLLPGDTLILGAMLEGAIVALERDFAAMSEAERNSDENLAIKAAFELLNNEFRLAHEDSSREITATLVQHLMVNGALLAVRDQVEPNMTTLQYYHYCAALASYAACITAKLHSVAKVETSKS